MGRVNLVKGYFRSISGFSEAKTIARQSNLPGFLQTLGIAGEDPFYAVIAEKIA